VKRYVSFPEWSRWLLFAPVSVLGGALGVVGAMVGMWLLAFPVTLIRALSGSMPWRAVWLGGWTSWLGMVAVPLSGWFLFLVTLGTAVPRGGRYWLLGACGVRVLGAGMGYAFGAGGSVSMVVVDVLAVVLGVWLWRVWDDGPRSGGVRGSGADGGGGRYSWISPANGARILFEHVECPVCGAELSVREGSRVVVCEGCGAELEVGEA